MARAKLVPITSNRYFMHYDALGFPGAPEVPIVAEPLVPLIEAVNEYLAANSTPELVYELVFLDCYLTPESQRYLYDETLRDLVREFGISRKEASEKIRGFVANPDKVFPHGTGGAVDVTLYVNREEAPMGTEFDEFSPVSASDWFRNNAPVNEKEELAHRNREMLRAAMENADFIGLDSEWWHYEFGTQRWSQAKGKPVILSEVLKLPR